MVLDCGCVLLFKLKERKKELLKLKERKKDELSELQVVVGLLGHGIVTQVESRENDSQFYINRIPERQGHRIALLRKRSRKRYIISVKIRPSVSSSNSQGTC